MAEEYNSYSFDEYPPTEILETDIYLKSYKQLSFQYRTKEDDNLIAYENRFKKAHGFSRGMN